MARRLRGRPLQSAAKGTMSTIRARLPAELKNWLVDSANRSARSLSAEAEYHLERARHGDELVSTIDRIIERIQRAKPC